MNDRGSFDFDESDAQRFLSFFDSLNPPTEPRARGTMALEALHEFSKSFRIRIWKSLISGLPELSQELEEARILAEVVALGDPSVQERLARSLEGPAQGGRAEGSDEDHTTWESVRSEDASV